MQGVKLHDRAHDIHMKDTFMAAMLPLLWQFVEDRHVRPLTHNLKLVPLSSHGCAAHPACKQGAPKSVDFSLCNAHGARLSDRIDRALEDMLTQNVFKTWMQLSAPSANLYGGHVYGEWCPP